MFSASLTFLLITWRRHLLSKNSQSSVRGEEVGKCTVRSACFLVPEAGSIQPKIPEISVLNSMDRFDPTGKVSKKTGPPFEVDHGRDPFNQNSNRSDREKWSTSKGGPVFSKLFWLDRTDPLSFGPKVSEILVEWIAPLVSAYEIEMISF